jgi:hypothetical protein
MAKKFAQAYSGHTVERAGCDSPLQYPIHPKKSPLHLLKGCFKDAFSAIPHTNHTACPLLQNCEWWRGAARVRDVDELGARWKYVLNGNQTHQIRPM